MAGNSGMTIDEVIAHADTLTPTCPNCSATEFDEDGDCVACKEPSVIEMGTGAEQDQAFDNELFRGRQCKRCPLCDECGSYLVGGVCIDCEDDAKHYERLKTTFIELMGLWRNPRRFWDNIDHLGYDGDVRAAEKRGTE